MLRRIIDATKGGVPIWYVPFTPRPSRYMPHQGEREKARRVRQLIKWGKL